MNIKSLCLAFGILLCVVGYATEKPVVRRGLVIETKETKSPDHKIGFSFKLYDSRDGKQSFLVAKFDHVTYYEVTVYQKILDMNPGETGEKIYVPVEDEVIYGEEKSRSERVDFGTWNNENFEFNGVPVKTDEKGVFADDNELVLQKFDADDLGKTKAIVSLKHAVLGQIEKEVSRKQLLESLGVKHMFDDRNPKTYWDSYDCLRVHKVTCPKVLKPGEQFQITLEVENPRDKQTGEIIGRTVSRHQWLNGKNFYIGILARGEKRIFTRTFLVSADVSPGDVFGEIGLYDHVLQAMPEKNVLLKLTVKQP